MKDIKIGCKVSLSNSEFAKGILKTLPNNEGIVEVVIDTEKVVSIHKKFVKLDDVYSG